MHKRLITFLSFLPVILCALPQGESVKSGEALFSKEGDALSIRVADKTIIDYQSFNIESQESIRFIQPKSTSTVLNRVQGGEPSKIFGKLTANGKVFLVNPNGVYFSPDAVVDTGSLIASTLDISNRDFTLENYSFSLRPGTENAWILNEGSLSAAKGGAVVLLAPHVLNEGMILADVGQVLIASAEKVTVDFSGDGMLQFATEGFVKEGAIAGKIVLHPQDVEKILQDVINADGIVIGTQLVEEEGVIRLMPASRIHAENIAITAANVEIKGELNASSDIRVETQDLLCIRDEKANPLLLYAGGHFTLDSPIIDIFAWNNQDTFFGASGKLTMISDYPISADASFYTGGDFSLLTHSGAPAAFGSRDDPIVTSGGSVTFGTYTGPSLKVEAAGNITCTGNITINAVDGSACSSAPCSSDPSCGALGTSKILILAAGTSPSVPSCNSCTSSSVMFSGTTFSNPGGSGSTVTLQGTIQAPDGVTITGSLVLASDLQITTSDGQVNLGTVDGNHNLTITAGTAIVTLGGAIGSNTSLQNVSVTSSGGINLGGNITTNANLAFLLTGPITLTNDVVLTSAGAPTFTGTIDGNHSFTLNSAHTDVFGGNIGSTTPLTNFSIENYFALNLGGLSVNANTISIQPQAGNSSLTVGKLIAGTGGINFTAAISLVLTNDITANNGPVFIRIGTLADPITLQAPVTISAGTSTITIIGNLLGTTAGIGVVLESTGTISLNGNIATNNGAVSIEGPLSLGSSSTITTANGAVSLDTVDGAQTFVVDSGTGIVTLNGNIGSSTPLSSVTLDGSALLGNNVQITTANGPVSLSSIDGMSSFSVNSGNGTITLGGNIGGSTPLSSLTLAGPVLLGNNVQIATANGPVSLSSVDGNHTLTVNSGSGTITLNGNIGSSTPLIGLTFNGPALLGSNIQMTTSNGPVSLSTINGSHTLTVNSGSGTITLNGNIGSSTPLTGLTLNGPALLGGNVQITTFNSPISLQSVDGAHALMMNAVSQTVTFGGDVGALTPLQALSITAGTIDFEGNNYIAGTQSYSASTLDFSAGGLVTLQSGAGGIAVNVGTIQITGGASFHVETGGGNFSFPSFQGITLANVAILTGNGTATLGQMMGVGSLLVVAGDILLQGSINCNQLSFTSNRSITNLASPVLLTSVNFQVFDALGGTVGSVSSPIFVDSASLVFAGAPHLIADFIGVTQDMTIHGIPNNLPCPLIFNGVTLISCTSPPVEVLREQPVIPARDFYVPGIYSQYNSLASDMYFLPEVVDPSYITELHNPLFSTYQESSARAIFFRTFGKISETSESRSR